jgi:hypothetical protein
MHPLAFQPDTGCKEKILFNYGIGFCSLCKSPGLRFVVGWREGFLARDFFSSGTWQADCAFALLVKQV